MTITRPTPLHYPFASDATSSYINTLPDAATGSYLASWKEGFPPVTMTPLAGGGVAPSGADFNGLLNAISSGVRWTGAGGLPSYDADVSTAIGGYPLGAVLALSSTTLGLVAATASGVTNDPNSDMSGWAPFGGVYSGGAACWAVDSSTSANAVTLTTRLPLASAALGMTLRFTRAGLTNTSTSVVISINGVIYPNLAQLDGTAVPVGGLAHGGIYELSFDGSKWRVASPLAASAADAQAQTSVGEFLSPAGLAAAMLGSNQSIGASSWYQKLPGGLILQGGTSTTSVGPGETANVAFPITFPTAALFAVPVVTLSGPTAVDVALSLITLSSSGLTVKNTGPVNTSLAFRWFAVGH